MSDELDRLITQWAARHAPELIAQAQADALGLARERLRARLVDALLAAAEARLTTPDKRAEPQLPQAPEPIPEQPVESRPSDPLVWVYGVVPAGSAPGARGRRRRSSGPPAPAQTTWPRWSATFPATASASRR